MEEKKALIDVIIPTYQPDERLDKLIARLNQQTVKPDHIILIKTRDGEKYHTRLGGKIFRVNINVGAYRSYGNVQIVEIDKKDFDHGATRDMGASLSRAEYILFMTQDAVPANKYLIEAVVRGFRDKKTAVVYGRQLAARNAGIIETYCRNFNYPKESRKKTEKDLPELGIKTYFNSNVCSAYRREVYEELGGFVKRTIFNEDLIMGAKIIKEGYTIFYNAKAKVIHSHRYTWMQQLRRNFDNGVSQKQYASVLGETKAEGEGIRLAGGMVCHLVKQGRFLLILPFLIECVFRYTGFILGKNYDKIPNKVCRKLSMSRSYWN